MPSEILNHCQTDEGNSSGLHKVRTLPEPKYYAIRHGKHCDGCIFLSWDNANRHISSYDKADYAMFQVFQDALQYLEQGSTKDADSEKSKSSKANAGSKLSDAAHEEGVESTPQLLLSPSLSSSSSSLLGRKGNHNQLSPAKRKRSCDDKTQKYSSDASNSVTAVGASVDTASPTSTTNKKPRTSSGERTEIVPLVPKQRNDTTEASVPNFSLMNRTTYDASAPLLARQQSPQANTLAQ